MIGAISSSLPQGPSPSQDASLIITGQVLAVDIPERLAQVSIRDTSLWLPAMPGRYYRDETNPGLVRVLVDATKGRPVLVLGPVDPRPPLVPATLTAATSTVATVTLDGVAHVLPYMAGAYGTLPRAVWVSLDDWGTPVLVWGPSAVGDQSAPPPAPAPSDGATVQVVQAVGPQWSGSWRATRSAWDRWNTDRYGGRSTLYQGNGHGSGPMVGLATYGDQLVNLGAISIDRVQVAVRPVGLASGSPAVTVQGSPHGSRPGGAPSASGATASGMGGLLDLPGSVAEGMRTGAVRGLATVGGAYSAVAGAGNGDGMVLTVTYTRRA